MPEDDYQQQIAGETALLFDPPPAAALTPAKRKAPLPSMLDDPRIAQAVRLMERTPATTTRLEDIAVHVGLSPFHFQRYFLDVMGETPSAYMRRTRLDRAAMNLQMSDEPVTRIAINAGYASHEAFIRAFHRQFGQVPTQYRAYAQRQRPAPLPEDLRRLPDVQVRRQPPLRLLGMRFHGPYGNVERHWLAFADYLRRRGFPLQQTQPIGVILDSPLITPNELVRYDCAVADPGFDARGSALSPLELAGGRYVTLGHEGPYWQIFSSLRALSLAWLPQSGEMFAPDANGGYEFYHRPPWENAGATQSLSAVLPLHDFG